MRAQGAGRRKKEGEGGRKRKEEKEKGKKEKKRKRRDGGGERESASAKLAAATAGPDEHARRSGSTQRVARNEGEQGDGMVIGTGVGTADRRERFREIRGLEKI